MPGCFGPLELNRPGLKGACRRRCPLPDRDSSEIGLTNLSFFGVVAGGFLRKIDPSSGVLVLRWADSLRHLQSFAPGCPLCMDEMIIPASGPATVAGAAAAQRIRLFVSIRPSHAGTQVSASCGFGDLAIDVLNHPRQPGPHLLARTPDMEGMNGVPEAVWSLRSAASIELHCIRHHGGEPRYGAASGLPGERSLPRRPLS
jgi:hypothetical protein